MASISTAIAAAARSPAAILYIVAFFVVLQWILNGTGRRAEFSVAYVTVPNAEAAAKLSTALLEAKLVACVNEVPGVTSRYWWKGNIESDQEHLLILKTRSSLEKEVIAAVKANHPYEVPEVIFAQIQDGNPAYLDWLRENTKQFPT